MPCYDGRNEHSDKIDNLSIEIRNLESRCNMYAAMLCEHCRSLEISGNHNLITGDLKEWWEAHKKIDKQRI